MDIQGIYTANSSSTVQQKEAQATHAGGIAGKNETTGIVEACYLENHSSSNLKAKFGMLGGVVGFNKGKIAMSGSSITADVMRDVTEETTAEQLNKFATEKENFPRMIIMLDGVVEVK